MRTCNWLKLVKRVTLGLTYKLYIYVRDNRGKTVSTISCFDT